MQQATCLLDVTHGCELKLTL